MRSTSPIVRNMMSWWLMGSWLVFTLDLLTLLGKARVGQWVDDFFWLHPWIGIIFVRWSQSWMRGFYSLACAKGHGMGHTCRGWWMQDYNATCPADVQLCINSWGDRAFRSGPSCYSKTAGLVGLRYFFSLSSHFKSLFFCNSVQANVSGNAQWIDSCLEFPVWHRSRRGCELLLSETAPWKFEPFGSQAFPLWCCLSWTLGQAATQYQHLSCLRGIFMCVKVSCSCLGVWFHQHAVCCHSALILLQVKLENEVPAKVSPLKPKYTLLGDVNVQAGFAVKLGWAIVNSWQSHGAGLVLLKKHELAMALHGMVWHDMLTCIAGYFDACKLLN